jgi:alpha-L-fucosidase
VTYPSKVPGYRWKATKDYFGALVNRCHQEGIPLIVYMGPDSFHAFIKDGPHMTEEMRDQKNVFAAVTQMINEIIDRHGEKIGGFWFDGNYREDMGKLVHARLPRGVVIHNNESGWGLTPSVDFGTTEFLSGPADPDYSRPTGLMRQHKDFGMMNPIRDFNEDIPNVGWWYEGREDAFYQALPHVKDRTYLVKQMVSSLGQRRQWNFALGIGPMIDGKLPPCFEPMIENTGRFMAWAGESIYDTMGGEGSALNPGWFNDGAYGSITVSRKDPRCHYILVTTAPSKDHLKVQNNGYRVASVVDLRTGKPVEFSDGGVLILRQVDWKDVSEFGAKVFKVTLAGTP